MSFTPLKPGSFLPENSLTNRNVAAGALDVSKVDFGFVFIDPSTEFFGISSNVQTTQYVNTYTSTSNGYIAQNHFLVHGENFPMAVFERVGESNVDPQEYYATRSSASMRRKSDLYTFEEMYENALSVSTKYGPDVSFEIQDATGNTKELGSINMVIDQLNPISGNIGAGFGVKVIDNAPNFGTVERQILYVDNNSNLAISGVLNLSGNVVGTTSYLGNVYLTLNGRRLAFA